MKTSKVISLACLILTFMLFHPYLLSANKIGTADLQSPPPSGLQMSVFEIDITPPLGSVIYDGKIMEKSWDMGLRAKGLVLLGAGKPLVLVAFDWIGIANDCQDGFKAALAKAAGTDPQRVAVHTLHQHDAYRPTMKDRFVLDVISRLETAVRNSLENTVPVTHLGLGVAQVYEVGSNRRILGPDGKVRAGRMSSCPDPAVRAEPEGLIDPMLSMVSFWNGEKPIAVLSFYATHPQSYYRLGIPNPDYPGIARFYRQLAVPDAMHIHFTGAGGNVAAGKYNDGSHEMRGILASRMADAMKRAWESTKREPLSAKNISWSTEPVALPPDSVKSFKRNSLDYWNRYKAGKTIDLQCLALNNSRIIFMPGELFVEYQLAAKKMRPDLFVTMAAYGDGGPGYIPTAIAFKQGGYEAGETSGSRLLPEVEGILMQGMAKLLKAKVPAPVDK